MQHFGWLFLAIILWHSLWPMPSASGQTGHSTQLAQADHSHPGHGSKAASGGAEIPAKKDQKGKSASIALKPAEGAKIKIFSPSHEQVFKGDKIPVQYKLTKGKRGHHAHAYIDGELVGMFETEKGTLNGIKPGKHVLEMRVVAEDHETELDATDKVIFIVR
jgi:hypothetical protein